MISRTLALIFASTLAFGCKVRTEEPAPAPQVEQKAEKAASDDPTDKTEKEGDLGQNEEWSPKPINNGGVGGGPSPNVTPTPTPVPASPPSGSKPSAPKPGVPKPAPSTQPTTAPSSYPWLPPSIPTWPWGTPDAGPSAPAPSASTPKPATPAPSSVPSTTVPWPWEQSGGWKTGQ